MPPVCSLPPIDRPRTPSGCVGRRYPRWLDGAGQRSRVHRAHPGENKTLLFFSPLRSRLRPTSMYHVRQPHAWNEPQVLGRFPPSVVCLVLARLVVSPTIRCAVAVYPAFSRPLCRFNPVTSHRKLAKRVYYSPHVHKRYEFHFEVTVE